MFTFVWSVFQGNTTSFWEAIIQNIDAHKSVKDVPGLDIRMGDSNTTLKFLAFYFFQKYLCQCQRYIFRYPSVLYWDHKKSPV